jgi:hypothetical protein
MFQSFQLFKPFQTFGTLGTHELLDNLASPYPVAEKISSLV